MRSGRATRAAVLAGLALASLVTGFGSPATARSEIHVPEDVPTLQLAIARAQPGDTIVLAPGTYPGGNVVPPDKHDITIRGADRNEVVLDGVNQRKHGIVVHADGVSILNLSAHDFRLNGVYWEGADRFRASYVTVWNVGGYGIYAEDGEEGVVDHAYVSGAADAAYYVGECKPCRATIANVVGALSAVGYLGTNATGVVIRDSLWDRNGAGILPNTYANEALAPQSRTTIVRYTVLSSGRAPEPGPPCARGATASRGTSSRAAAGRTSRARGSGKGNCFTHNVAARSSPRGLQTPTCARVSATGEAAVAADLTRPVRVMFEETMRRRGPPDYTSMPAPAPQPNMP